MGHADKTAVGTNLTESRDLRNSFKLDTSEADDERQTARVRAAVAAVKAEAEARAPTQDEQVFDENVKYVRLYLKGKAAKYPRLITDLSAPAVIVAKFMSRIDPAVPDEMPSLKEIMAEMESARELEGAT